MAAEGDLRCKNPECRVSASEKCVEGLALDACPHFGKLPPARSTPDGEPLLVTLPSAGRLSVGGASSLRGATDSRVLAVIGPADSGKTSLIAAVYDLLQSGPNARYSYARSRTLHAFEEACHKARLVSERSEPGMSRTPVSDVAFYHLQLRTQASEALVDLLLADRAGEDYRTVADNPSVCDDYVELRRADSVTVLVDGTRLLDSVARHNVRNEVLMILQGVSDRRVVRNGQAVALVLTKLDEIEAADEGVKTRGLRDFDSLVQQVTGVFRSWAVTSYRVAASPRRQVEGISRGAGVGELFDFWMSRYRVPPTPQLEAPPAPRAFGRLTLQER